MKKIQLLSFLTLFILFFQCKKTTLPPTIPNQTKPFISIQLEEDNKTNWYLKDIVYDSIPGISLERAYNTILKNKKGEEVIVAVIDTEIDINHEDLSANVWTNTDEIAGNDIDDDSNGYVDDIYGWNFLGNSNGENVLYANYEHTRIIRKYNSFWGIEKLKNDTILKNLLELIKTKHASDLKKTNEAINYITMVDKSKKESHKYLSKYLKDNYTIEDLDSLKTAQLNDTLLNDYILKMSNFINYGLTDDYIKNYKNNNEQKISKLLNLDYDERLLIGDSSNDISDRKYGNNEITNNINVLYHGTLVAGIIAAVIDNGIGANGFSNKIKIMPLCISPIGDEHDKDIALAIRYAVSNGAKIINLSFGKPFSLQPDWVQEAIKYAEENDVIIITSAGNNFQDLDNKENYNYPNDTDVNNNELVSNFIKVGASNFLLDSTLNTRYSNYGKTEVDIFAPGESIYSLMPNNKYKFHRGTSVATPIVSGTAALIRSHYPNLTASQVKQIIMESGISYDILVNVPTIDDKNRKLPFIKLSKSGKIVNAYNALIVADSISRN